MRRLVILSLSVPLLAAGCQNGPAKPSHPTVAAQPAPDTAAFRQAQAEKVALRRAG